MALTLTPETESRVLAAAARRNQAPEALIDAALTALLRDEPLQTAPAEEADEESDEERQTRLRRLMAAVLEEARTQEPEPYDSPARTYYRNHPFAQGVAEKMRQQGFNVD